MAGEWLKPELYNGYYVVFKKAWFGLSVQATAWKNKKVIASVSGSDKAEAFAKIKILLKGG